jgi:NAD(P)-dependent dehydrogenase (short-subunit alcohol dehydrogenase family)
VTDDYLSQLYGLGGRVALVTGGSYGLGRAIASALARAGASVVIAARRQAPLRETAEALRGDGCSVEALSADLADRDAVHRLAIEVPGVFGPPDVLVNAAAVNARPHLEDLTAEQWDETLAVNLSAPFLLGQAFGPGMAARGWGRILNIASQQAVRAYGNSGAYGASKAGLTGLTRSQAEAWSSSGVCCNAIAPGVVQTPLTEPIFRDPQRAAAMAARTMVGRNGVAEDFAGVAVFLAGPAARYVTGQTVFVDGGFSVA